MVKETTSELQFAERYDQEDDIYYVAFKTGEPSCVIEHDDRIIFEVGIFTGRPTGFRILNFTKHKKEVAGFKNDLRELFRLAKVRAKADSQAMENRIGKFLEKVTA